MKLTTTANAIYAALAAGHTNRADIAKLVGCKPHTVTHYLGPIYDSAKWEAERRRHAAFFKGLSPAKEYDAHVAARRGVDEW
jgi:DNA-binding NarL/FixJ family response regulator